MAILRRRVVSCSTMVSMYIKTAKPGPQQACSRLNLDNLDWIFEIIDMSECYYILVSDLFTCITYISPLYITFKWIHESTACTRPILKLCRAHAQ